MLGLIAIVASYVLVGAFGVWLKFQHGGWP
jgi:hypothetical protein